MSSPDPGFSLHHIGYVVGDIDQAREEFVTGFGYVVETDVIHDPTQTARVQFLRLGTSPVLLELVAPDSEHSKLAGALRRGQTLHHLCYVASDLTKAANVLRERGMFQVSTAQPAVAFGGRLITWFMDRHRGLVELLEEA